MGETLKGLQRTAVYMDDVIVHGKDVTEPDQHPQRVMERPASAGLRLNIEKCALRQGRLHFMGNKINVDSVWPDTDKMSAISELTPSRNVQEVKTVLRMVKYLGRHVPSLSTVGQPLYELLKCASVWTWGPAQQSTFQHIKAFLTTSPTLVLYDVKPTGVSVDASSYSVSVVLMELHGGQEDPLLVLMCYRSTPCCSTAVSPAQLLMGRKIPTTLPTLNHNLRPRWLSRQRIRAIHTDTHTQIKVHQTLYLLFFTSSQYSPSLISLSVSFSLMEIDKNILSLYHQSLYNPMGPYTLCHN